MTPRYAIYALPGALAPDPLRGLAEAWLGRAGDGAQITPAVPDGWTRADVDAITVDARRYGFHATLKAPFRLHDGVSATVLAERVAAVARAQAPVTVPDVVLDRLDGFYALMPGAGAPALHALADTVVRALDDLRAPITEAERARRQPERLTPRQRELLDTWGYPYVLDEFRAHFTLTDRIAERRGALVAAALRGHLAQQLGRDLWIDALCVFVEPEPGAPFRLGSVHALGAGEPGATEAVLVSPAFGADHERSA